MIIKGILALVILLIIPVLLGFLFIRFLKEDKNNIFLAIVLGYIAEFAICQIIAVPMIFLEYDFMSLLKLYILIVSVLSIFSLILNAKRLKEIFKETITSIKRFPLLLTVITIVLIGLQVYAFLGYAHIDDDDAFYVGTATVTVQTNTLYKYSPTTGETGVGDHLSLRYRLAPFPIFISIISQIISVHPAIVAHIVIPIVLIPIVYIVYGLIANELFKGDKKNVLFFLIVMCVLHIWGGYSIRSNFAFLLFRIWQGKSVLANMIIPVIILLFMKAEKNEFKFINCLLLFIAILAGNFTTTMGVGLPPIVLMLLCIVYELLKINYKDIKNNNFKLHLKNIFKCLVCCVPSIIYGFMFFI